MVVSSEKIITKVTFLAMETPTMATPLSLSSPSTLPVHSSSQYYLIYPTRLDNQGLFVSATIETIFIDVWQTSDDEVELTWWFPPRHRLLFPEKKTQNEVLLEIHC